jgi:23S rRNA (cytidine2498-2'-O)-methyltransferase
MFIITTNPDSDDLALNEARRVLPSLRLVADLAPGVLLIDAGEGDFAQLAAHWREKPPVFSRHLCPANHQLDLAGSVADLPNLLSACTAHWLAGFDSSASFSVQTRLFTHPQLPLAYKPYDLNQALAAHIGQATGATLAINSPAQVLSLAVAASEASNGEIGYRAYAGVSSVYDNLSDWAGGALRYRHDDTQISRAEFKLLEALHVFGIDLPDANPNTPNGHALDLGAAPGGWTRVLRQKGFYVTAIDPAALHDSLYTDKHVRPLRMKAERYLQGDTDTYDLIVNDMRLDGRDSARLMVDYARLLRPAGFALMTLKLPERGRQPVLEGAFYILRGAYQIANARQLFHNRSEITIFLRPK